MENLLFITGIIVLILFSFSAFAFLYVRNFCKSKGYIKRKIVHEMVKEKEKVSELIASNFQALNEKIEELKETIFSKEIVSNSEKHKISKDCFSLYRQLNFFIMSDYLVYNSCAVLPQTSRWNFLKHSVYEKAKKKHIESVRKIVKKVEIDLEVNYSEIVSLNGCLYYPAR